MLWKHSTAICSSSYSYSKKTRSAVNTQQWSQNTIISEFGPTLSSSAVLIRLTTNFNPRKSMIAPVRSKSQLESGSFSIWRPISLIKLARDVRSHRWLRYGNNSYIVHHIRRVRRIASPIRPGSLPFSHSQTLKANEEIQQLEKAAGIFCPNFTALKLDIITKREEKGLMCGKGWRNLNEERDLKLEPGRTFHLIAGHKL